MRKQKLSVIDTYPLVWTHDKAPVNYNELSPDDRQLKLPPLEVLQHLFSYEPTTGTLFRIRNHFGKILPEPKVVNVNANRQVSITDSNRDKTLYFIHRIIWKLHYGDNPTGIIDHIDRDHTNNRIINLRIVDQATNTRNVSMQKRNTSGFTGVCFHKPNNKWLSYISVNGKRKHIGYYSTREEAYSARKEAIDKLNLLLGDNGYTANHGT